MIFPNPECQAYWDGWRDYQAPYTKWIQYERTGARSLESYRQKAQERRELVRRRAGPGFLTLRDGNPALQRRDRQPKILRNLRQWRLALAGHINNILAELRPISRGHGQHPSTSTSSLGQGVNKTGGSPGQPEDQWVTMTLADFTALLTGNRDHTEIGAP